MKPKLHIATSILWLAVAAQLAGCGSSSFGGGGGLVSSKGDKKESQESSGSAPDGGSAGGGDAGESSAGDTSGDATPGTTDGGDGTSTTAENVKECALALGGQDVDVISISQGSEDLKLTPNSIVLLEVTGQAEINIGSADVAAIKGICINEHGGASIKLDTSLVVAGIYCFGRGNAEALIDFGATGSLSKLTTNLGGNNDLTIKGSKVDCEALAVERTGGNATIQCNGKLVQ